MPAITRKTLENKSRRVTTPPTQNMNRVDMYKEMMKVPHNHRNMDVIPENFRKQPEIKEPTGLAALWQRIKDMYNSVAEAVQSAVDKVRDMLTKMLKELEDMLMTLRAQFAI